MTKTLTEQWREGKLQFGFYYVKFPNEKPQIYSSEYLKSFTVVKDAGRIDILAPVSSYDEDKKLKEQLADASKTIERLKEQLKEAEYILDKMGWADRGLIDDYFEKWGVKWK